MSIGWKMPFDKVTLSYLNNLWMAKWRGKKINICIKNIPCFLLFAHVVFALFYCGNCVTNVRKKIYFHILLLNISDIFPFVSNSSMQLTHNTNCLFSFNRSFFAALFFHTLSPSVCLRKCLSVHIFYASFSKHVSNISDTFDSMQYFHFHIYSFVLFFESKWLNRARKQNIKTSGPRKSDKQKECDKRQPKKKSESNPLVLFTCLSDPCRQNEIFRSNFCDENDDDTFNVSLYSFHSSQTFGNCQKKSKKTEENEEEYLNRHVIVAFHLRCVKIQKRKKP